MFDVILASWLVRFALPLENLLGRRGIYNVFRNYSF